VTTFEINKPEDEWWKVLTSEQFRVLRNHGTRSGPPRRLTANKSSSVPRAHPLLDSALLIGCRSVRLSL
jgi:hypothetical protein